MEEKGNQIKYEVWCNFLHINLPKYLFQKFVLKCKEITKVVETLNSQVVPHKEAMRIEEEQLEAMRIDEVAASMIEEEVLVVVKIKVSVLFLPHPYIGEMGTLIMSNKRQDFGNSDSDFRFFMF